MVSTSKNCIKLRWTPPEDDRGVTITGYQVEKRKKDTNQWIALNAPNEPIKGLSKQSKVFLCNCDVVVKMSPFLVFLLFAAVHPSEVKYAVKEITEGAEYEFRVSAINESGLGDPSPPSLMVCAKSPNSELSAPGLLYCTLTMDLSIQGVVSWQHLMLSVWFLCSEALF